MNAGKSLVCIPICALTERELKAALQQAAPQAELLEFRLDCLEGVEFARVVQHLPALIESAKRPVILTLRPADQGGGRPIALETRYEFWSSEYISSAAYYDIELDIVLDLSLVESSIDWDRVICSYHNFEGATEGLEKIYEQMLNTRARIMKIAVRADDATDCLPIFRLLARRADAEGRHLIAIAMGGPGTLTRILGPARGSFLTYGANTSHQATAPGQVTVDELQNVYRIDKIDKQTEVLGIMGKPVAHSFSPRIHNAAFAATDINAVFLPFEVQNLGRFLTRMVDPRTRELEWNLRGLSVTAPHKRSVLNHLDWIDLAAKEIGAVNTIVLDGNRLLGYNTDVLGFVSSLREVLGELRGLRAAVIGAGGAARAALWALKKEGAEAVVFARDSGRGQLLATEFGAECVELADASFGGFDIVINATPLGTFGTFTNEVPATTEQLRGTRLVYDLVYNPSDTQFLREARAAGCETLGGLPMLVSQATAQFKLWTGVDAPEKIMRAAAEKAVRETNQNRQFSQSLLSHLLHRDG